MDMCEQLLQIHWDLKGIETVKKKKTVYRECQDSGSLCVGGQVSWTVGLLGIWRA